MTSYCDTVSGPKATPSPLVMITMKHVRRLRRVAVVSIVNGSLKPVALVRPSKALDRDVSQKIFSKFLLGKYSRGCQQLLFTLETWLQGTIDEDRPMFPTNGIFRNTQHQTYLAQQLQIVSETIRHDCAIFDIDSPSSSL